MDNTIKIRIKLEDAARFAGETEGATLEVEGLGDAIARANRKSREGAGGMNILQRAMKLVKPALIVAGIGLLVQTLNLGIAAAIGFGGALAPLAGLFATIPAFALGAAQGAGVLALAFVGVTGAVGGLNAEMNPKKFAALTPPAQEFALTLDSLKKPIVGLQRAVQGGLFPGLTKGISAAKPALTALLGPLTGTGRVFGTIGDRLGHLVGSKGFLKDLSSQARFNNVQLGLMGGAGLHAVDSLRQLTVTSRPLVHWLVLLVAGWSATIDRTLTADRANGKLARTFGIVKHVASDVLKIGGNVAKTIFNIGNIGRKSLGESLLTSLLKGSESLKRWSESGPGIAKVTTFFERAKPVVYAFAELLRGAVKDFLKFGSSPGSGRALTGFFNQVRTEVLPQLLKVTETVTKLFELITTKVPGGGWLITIGYTLHKLGGTSLLGGITGGLGKSLGERISGGLTQDKGLFGGAGRSLGLVMGASLIAAVVMLAKSKLGHEIEEAVGLRHQKLSPLDLAIKSPATITPQSLVEMSNGERNELQKIARVDKERHYPAATFWGTNHLKKVAEGERKKTQSAMQIVEQQYNHPSKKHHPKLALGGILVQSGMVEVGEHGPELLSLPRAASVIPLTPSLRAPAMEEVKSTGGSRDTSEAPIHIHTHTTLKLNSQPIAEGTNDVVARHKSLK